MSSDPNVPPAASAAPPRGVGFIAGLVLGALLAGLGALFLRPGAPAPQETTRATTPAPIAAPATNATPLADEAIARVDGERIPLRALEDALLAKEGADEIEQWVRERVRQLSWPSMADDAELLRVGQAVLTRGLLAIGLLERRAGEVREELIGIQLAEAAIRREGVVVSQAVLDREYERIERKFQADAARRGQALVAYEDVLRERFGKSKTTFFGERGFRMGAGLHELIFRRARAAYATPAGEAELLAYFERQRARFDQPEAVRLSTLFIPYEKRGRGRDGKEIVLQVDRDNAMSLMIQFHINIAKQAQSFEDVWNRVTRTFDKTGPGGDLGFVARDGKRSIANARVLPAAAMELAFRDTRNLPRLLQPVEGPDGVDLLRVTAYREARPADFAAMRLEIAEACIEETLDKRTEQLLRELRQSAVIDYVDLPALIRLRAAAASAASGP